MPRPDDTVVLCADGPAPAPPRRASRPVRVAGLAAAERLLQVLRVLGYRDRTLVVRSPDQFVVRWR